MDDFLVICFPQQQWTDQDLIELTSAVGVPWSQKKTRPLAVCQCYIGFVWDLSSKTVALPDKVDAVLELIHRWSTKGQHFSSHEAASLHGKLVHVSCIFKLIRPSLWSLAHFSHGFHMSRGKLLPPQAVTADLSWIRFIISISPPSRPLTCQTPINIGWWGDTSPSFGIRIVI